MWKERFPVGPKDLKDNQTEKGLDAYRQGTITLSRAAETAGLSLRDLLPRLPEESINPACKTNSFDPNFRSP